LTHTYSLTHTPSLVLSLSLSLSLSLLFIYSFSHLTDKVTWYTLTHTQNPHTPPLPTKTHSHTHTEIHTAEKHRHTLLKTHSYRQRYAAHLSVISGALPQVGTQQWHITINQTKHICLGSSSRTHAMPLNVTFLS